MSNSRTELESLQAGLEVQRTMFGSEMADRALERASDFARPFQEMLTRHCFGDIWTRPGLGRRERSMITLAMLLALDRPQEIQVHVRGALANHVTADEIREVLMHGMIYCGLPLAVGAFRAAEEALNAAKVAPQAAP